MKIDKEILKKTTRCEKKFECLKNENYTCIILKVESHANGKVLFVNCENYICKYKMNFGDGTVCNCPTRQEIFRKYNK